MSGVLRRVVTGHDAQGRSLIARDEAVAAIASGSGESERSIAEIWATIAGAVPATGHPSSTLGPSASEIRIVEMPPGHRREMHRTDTIDYGVVLAGEVTLLLERGETVLRAGDVVIQRGTLHAWHNRGGVPARMLFVNMSGQVSDPGRCPVT